MIESINQKFDRINNLSNGLGLDENDQSTINGWQTKAREAIVRDNLAEHEGMKAFMEFLNNQVKDINELLLGKKDLTVEERNSLFDRREWCNSIINFFKVSKSTIESIEKTVDVQIDHLENLKNQ
jgi:hypothetical protein